MTSPVRAVLILAAGMLLFGQSACLVPATVLRQSQARSWQLHQERLAFEQQNAELQGRLHTANQRIDNYKNGMSQLEQQNLALLNRLKNSRNPLGRGITKRLQDLSGKYKNFEFDPETGVSKFHSDILFDIGSDRVKPHGMTLLREFAAIMNEGEAGKLNILVVGHTDDRRIAHSSTRRKHPTNWHLSTNRANSVVLALTKHGIRESRLGAAGYSMYQPIAKNKDDHARQLNRRVEIYVLAPDAVVAGQWNREAH
ncbi:MAG: flagellar motor protein MotB [Planctomycetaceae bacterium]